MGIDVFISYSSEDFEVARAVQASYAKYKITSWMAPDNIPAGKDYAVAIEEALEECKVFVLVLSAHSNRSEHVRNEIDLAASNKMKLITLRMEDVVLAKGLKYHLQRRQWVNAYQGPLTQHLETLVKHTKALLGMNEYERAKKCYICSNNKVYPEYISICSECGNFLQQLKEEDQHFDPALFVDDKQNEEVDSTKILDKKESYLMQVIKKHSKSE